MKCIPSPFGSERRLTLEQFDHYVAKARDERNKAIAAFLGQAIAAASAIAARLLRGRRRARTIPLDPADLPTR